jgi:hypothetical protein
LQGAGFSLCVLWPRADETQNCVVFIDGDWNSQLVESLREICVQNYSFERFIYFFAVFNLHFGRAKGIALFNHWDNWHYTADL